MDLSVSGRQIGETIFNLLNAEQQHDMVNFIMEIEKLVDHAAGFPCVSSPQQIKQSNSESLTEIQVGNLYFCLEERQVSVYGRQIDLTAREFNALHLLLINQKRVMTFETIFCHVWGEEYVENELTAIHNIMSRLRQKLRITPDVPDYIRSVRGVGYKFEPSP